MIELVTDMPAGTFGFRGSGRVFALSELETAKEWLAG
jgi:hypothetical protein